MNKVSIIIPVYNTEKYLKECLNSVLSQTYKNLEIVCIDDGSTDNSGKILDSYKINDKRIKAYHIKNGGVSNARNLGISKSTGDYITFLDSDDTINNNSIEMMVKLLENNECDIVRSNYCINSWIAPIYDEIIGKHECEKIIPYILKGIPAFCWLLLIKRELLVQNKILFNCNLCMMEDTIFLVDLLKNSDSIYCTKEVSINYRVVEESASRNKDKINKNINSILAVNKYVKKLELGESNIKIADNKQFKIICDYITELVTNDLNDKIINELRKNKQFNSMMLNVKPLTFTKNRYLYTYYYKCFKNNNMIEKDGVLKLIKKDIKSETKREKVENILRNLYHKIKR